MDFALPIDTADTADVEWALESSLLATQYRVATPASPGPDGALHLIALPSSLWSFAPMLRIRVARTVSGATVLVRTSVALRWQAAIAILAFASLAAARLAWRPGPIEAGYGVATTPFWHWPDAAAALVFVVALTAVLAMAHLQRRRIESLVKTAVSRRSV